MCELKINLDTFIDKIYGINVFDDNFLMQDNFYFSTEHIEVEEKEIDKVIEHFNLEKDKREYIEDIISIVKSRRYKETYIDDYWENLKKEIEDNILKSMWKIIETMELENMEHEKNFKDPDLSIYVDFKEKSLKFYGDIELLEDIIISCVNGHGMFRYESIEDFRRVYEGYSLEERINGHIHWLKYFTDIWGINVFNIDLNNISRYSYGNPNDYTMEDIKEEIMMFDSELLE